MTSETQPESGTTSYTYDAVGNLASTTDANNNTTTLTYDGDNRLTNRDAPGTVDDLAIAYDTSGRVHTLTGGGSTTTYTYNVAARTVTRSDVTAAGTFTSTYQKDANDNLLQITYPTGRLVDYSYDGEDNLTAVNYTAPGSQTSTPFATSFTYGPDGRLASYVTGAVTHQFTYAAGRPQRLFTTGGTDTLDLTYSYDNAGNVSGITDPRANASQTFATDPLDRLTTANGPWGSLTWTYDGAGNRLTQTTAAGTTSYSYNAATQRLTSTAGAQAESFTYDSVGQVTSDTIISQYTYSPTGKLTAATGTGVSATYTYDAAGERLSSAISGQTSYTIRGVGGETLSEYLDSCGSLVWTRDLIYAGGQLLGAAKAVTTLPTVAMSAATLNVGEAAGNAVATVTLTTPGGAALGCPVTVSYDTTPGTATSGADYTATHGTLTFASGSANGATQTISVPIVNDTVSEDNETFTVTLTSPEGASLGTIGATTVTILDDDPLPSLSIADGSVTEGNAGTTPLNLTVTLSTASQRTISVHYATADGTATAPGDYAAASGTLTFAPGVTSQSVPLSIVGDLISEGDETFTVTLSSPVNATLSRATATATIVDDDPAVRMLVGPGSYPSDGGWFSTRLGPPDYAHGAWQQVNWPAYTSTNGELHIAAGNLDGDPEPEYVIGFGSGGNGWLEVLDDADHGYAVLGWIQVPWSDYDSANGTTYPAIGDIDGDAVGEIVVGLGPGGQGKIAIFEGATGSGGQPFAFKAWRQLDWADYNNQVVTGATGEVHPAVGNVDGTGEAEIILGLGPGGAGWLEVLNGASTGYSLRTWLQIGWSAYPGLNGATWPAAGDVDGDGRDEIVVGLDSGGAGWIQVFDDANAGFATLQWLQLPWSAYNSALGTIHPAVGDIDGDGKAEIVAGLGPYEGGWLMVWDDATTGFAQLQWIQLDATHTDDSHGASWPAIGHFNR